MITIRRATSVAALEALLRKIENDDHKPLILVDRQGDGVREPEYTVVWVRHQIDPDQ